MAVYSENAGYNPNIGDAPHWQAEPSNIRRVRVDFPAIIAARAATAVDGTALTALTANDQLVLFKCKAGAYVRAAGLNVIDTQAGLNLSIGEVTDSTKGANASPNDTERFLPLTSGLTTTVGQRSVVSDVDDADTASEAIIERGFLFSDGGDIVLGWNALPTTAVVDVWADIVDTVPDTSVPSELPNRNYVNPT